MEEYKSLIVMVVDDEEMVRDVLASQLKSLGFETIMTADDGDIAIETLSSTHVDLIISDWKMSRVNGTEVLKFVRSHPILKDLPFIMYSGLVPEEVIAEAAETKVDAYMLKPITISSVRLENCSNYLK